MHLVLIMTSWLNWLLYPQNRVKMTFNEYLLMKPSKTTLFYKFQVCNHQCFTWIKRAAMHLASFKICFCFFSKLSFGFHRALKLIGIWNWLTRFGINSSKEIHVVLPVQQWIICTMTFLHSGTIIIKKFLKA